MSRYWRAAAAALLVVFASSQVSAEQVTLDWVGLSVSIPDDWEVLYRADLDTAASSDGTGLAYIDRASARGELALLLAAGPRDGSTAVVKFAAHNEMGHGPASVMEIAQGTMQYMKANASGFEVLSGPERVQLGGQEGAHTRYGFIAPINGNDSAVTCDLWILPFRGRFMQIGATFASENGSLVLPIAEQIVRSARFDVGQ